MSAASPRILLVGAGTMGSLHARVVAQSGVATLSGVVDAFPNSGQRLAERFDVDWTPELTALDQVDGVIVAASTEAHFDLCAAVLESGTPLLVEKPVAAGLEQTEQTLALSERTGTPMMCGLLERFNPAVITARALISEPVHVTATRHSPYAPRIKTGVSWDLLVHDVDLAISTVGSPITAVTGGLSRFHPTSLPGAEDVAEAVLSFDNGAVAQISASRIGQRKVRSLNVYELDRHIEIDLLRRDVTVYFHVSGQAADDGRGYRQQTVIEIPELATSQEPLAAQLEHFVGLINGTVDADAERASIAPSHQVIDALQRASHH